MPKTLQIDWDHPANLQSSVRSLQGTLKSGGVIAFPTDTFYGLGADPFNASAVSRLFEIKQRPKSKPILVLVASPDSLTHLVEKVSPLAERLMEKFWPGPLTILFPVRPELPPELSAGTGKIGIRLPGNEFTRRLIDAVGHPLTAPSANLNGGQEPLTVAQLEIDDAIDAIVDGGPTPGGKASTVIDPTEFPPRYIRDGAVPRSDIEWFLNQKCRTD